MHANIDVHIKRLIAEFPGYGMKFIEKFIHIVPTLLLLTKVGMIEFSSKSHIKEGGQQ